VSGNATCCPAGAPCKEHRHRANPPAVPAEHAAAQAIPAARELQFARELLVIRALLDRAELREMCLQALAAHPGHDLPAVPAAGTGERRSAR
jgi:hypothetical protein